MPDLDSVVAAAFAGAEGGGDGDGDSSIDAGAADAGDGGTGEGDSGAPDDAAAGAGTAGEDDGAADGSIAAAAGDPAISPSSAAAKDKKAVAAKELSEGEKLLEAEGFKATKDPLGRENRIPHSRVVKMIETSLKKDRDAAEAKHGEVLQPLKQKAETLDAIDQLIVNDPEKYMGMLATLHPKLYGRYVRGEPAKGDEKPGVAAAGDNAADPEPGPDVQFTDGTTGFSPEQFGKLRAWDRRQAGKETEGRLRGELDKRLSPFEQERKAYHDQTQATTTLRQEIASVREDFGDLFDADYKAAEEGKSEIIAYMAKHPGISLTRAASAVLIPKIKAQGTADRTKMRGELLTEINGRKAAAAGTPATSGGKKEQGPRSIEQVIKDSIDAAGIR